MTHLALEASNPAFWKGIFAFGIMFSVFVGSTWLLLSMILGPKLAYFVTASCFLGVLLMLSGIWFVTGLGPKGEQGFFGNLGVETAWEAVETGPHLGSVKSQYGDFNVGDYPNGWITPSKNKKLADLSGDDSTLTEVANVHPVMEALVLDAISPIPGKRKEVAPHVKGDVKLQTENFVTTDIKMKEAKVRGKDSILAVGRAAPSANLLSGNLGGAQEGIVTRFIAKQGAQLKPGDPVLEVTANKNKIVLTSDKTGRLAKFGFRLKDKIKPNVTFATLDITGQPGAPPPVEILAVRVRGSVRVPAFIYLAASFGLLCLHLLGLSRVERRQKALLNPASA